MAQSNPSPERTPYDILGGDAPLRRLVERFYALMDETPEYYGVRKLHPESLAGSTDKLHWFLSGWMGGPALYAERIGAPMLRARHLPFRIGIKERDQWLACMQQAMNDMQVEPALARRLAESFFGTADWMRNRAGA